MTIKIDEKIVGYEVVPPGLNSQGAVIPRPAKTQGHEPAPIVPYDRPISLRGATYKITPPSMNAALYVTINDIELPDGSHRPFEVFLNSKDVTHEQWMKAVTRLLSAIFRQPLPFEFAIQELKEIVDPNGAYFIPKGNAGGKGKCGGIAAHIGRVIEEHCKTAGIIKKPELDEKQKTALAAKKAEAESKGVKGQECPKCHEMAMYVMDGCLTCVSCGESKCG